MGLALNDENIYRDEEKVDKMVIKLEFREFPNLFLQGYGSLEKQTKCSSQRVLVFSPAHWVFLGDTTDYLVMSVNSSLSLRLI